jgi:uncharacterized protein YkwD
MAVMGRDRDPRVPRIAAPAAPSPGPSTSAATIVSVFEPAGAGVSRAATPATLHALPTVSPPAPVPPPSPPASNPPGTQVDVELALTNQARAAAALAPLVWSACLQAMAVQHAHEMANAGRIYHGDGVQRDLACGTPPARSGENVGETPGGVNDQQIFDAFMASSGHRDNILGGYRFFAAAWVVGADGNGYVSVEFLG